MEIPRPKIIDIKTGYPSLLEELPQTADLLSYVEELRQESLRRPYDPADRSFQSERIANFFGHYPSSGRVFVLSSAGLAVSSLIKFASEVCDEVIIPDGCYPLEPFIFDQQQKIRRCVPAELESMAEGKQRDITLLAERQRTGGNYVRKQKADIILSTFGELASKI